MKVLINKKNIYYIILTLLFIYALLTNNYEKKPIVQILETSIGFLSFYLIPLFISKVLNIFVKIKDDINSDYLKLLFINLGLFIFNFSGLLIGHIRKYTGFVTAFVILLIAILISWIINKKLNINFFNKEKTCLILRYLVFLVYITLFANFLLKGFISGGRWDLLEHIGMADRISDFCLWGGVLSYSGGAKDLFSISSPYFPGIAGLATFINKFASGFSDYILLFIASLIGILFVFMLTKLTKKMNVENNFAVLSTLFFICFYLFSWCSYMVEFKPDTISLLFASFIPFLLFELKNKNKILFFILIILSLYIIGIMKQQAVAIYAGLFLYFIFNKQFILSDKIKLCLTILLSGIFVLLTVINIPNCIYFTISVMSKHPLQTWIDNYAMFKCTLFSNLLLISFIFAYLLNQIKNYKNNTKYETIWLFMVLPWFFMSCISSMKMGGNGGNIEVGILPLIPFAAKYLYNCIQINLQKINFKTIPNNIFIITIFLNKFNYIFKERESKIQYLKEHYANMKTLFDGDDYMIAKRAQLNLVSEMNTAGHILLSSDKEEQEKFSELIKNKTWDLIYLSYPLEENDEILLNYRLLNDTPFSDSMFLYVPIK